MFKRLRECWNGRQARLRCVWLCRVGSSPISRTKKEDVLLDVLFFAYHSINFQFLKLLLDFCHPAMYNERKIKSGDEYGRN